MPVTVVKSGASSRTVSLPFFPLRARCGASTAVTAAKCHVGTGSPSSSSTCMPSGAIMLLHFPLPTVASATAAANSARSASGGGQHTLTVLPTIGHSERSASAASSPDPPEPGSSILSFSFSSPSRPMRFREEDGAGAAGGIGEGCGGARKQSSLRKHIAHRYPCPHQRVRLCAGAGWVRISKSGQS